MVKSPELLRWAVLLSNAVIALAMVVTIGALLVGQRGGWLSTGLLGVGGVVFIALAVIATVSGAENSARAADEFEIRTRWIANTWAYWAAVICFAGFGLLMPEAWMTVGVRFGLTAAVVLLVRSAGYLWLSWRA